MTMAQSHVSVVVKIIEEINYVSTSINFFFRNCETWKEK